MSFNYRSARTDHRITIRQLHTLLSNVGNHLPKDAYSDTPESWIAWLWKPQNTWTRTRIVHLIIKSKDYNNKLHEMRRSAQIVKCSLLGDKNLNFAQFIKKGGGGYYLLMVLPPESTFFTLLWYIKCLQKCTSSLCNQNLIRLYVVYYEFNRYR
jgi:hypothetical protein